MSRVDTPEQERNDFFLYVDEFQNFATSSFASILSEARKYRLSLILGHQYIAQMEEDVRDAVFGNMGTIVSFRIGPEDAEFLEKEFFPEFLANDLVNLPKYNAYVKLMIDGISAKPFSAETLPPIIPPSDSNVDKIISSSREKYGTLREITEDKIRSWFEESKLPVSISEQSKELYDAICSNCSKKTKVVFKPDETRPIFCKTCRKNRKKDDNSVSLDEISKKEPVLFSDLRKEKKDDDPKKRKDVEINKLRETLRKTLNNKENNIED